MIHPILNWLIGRATSIAISLGPCSRLARTDDCAELHTQVTGNSEAILKWREQDNTLIERSLRSMDEIGTGKRAFRHLGVKSPC